MARIAAAVVVWTWCAVAAASAQPAPAPQTLRMALEAAEHAVECAPSAINPMARGSLVKARAALEAAGVLDESIDIFVQRYASPGPATLAGGTAIDIAPTSVTPSIR